MPAPIAINVSTTPQLAWAGRNSAAGDSLLLINNDIVNTITVGTSVTGLIVPIGPLGSISVDPTENWYVVGLVKGTAPMIVAPGGTTWTPAPSQVAASISALGLATQATLAQVNANTGNTVTTLGTPAQSSDVQGLTANGIPLLRGTDQLGTATGSVLGSASTVTLLTTLITKPSFEAVFQLYLPAGAGTVPFAILAVNWEDAATGFSVGYKEYAIAAGNGNVNAISVYLTGPSRGNKLVLTLQNLDPAQIMTYTWLFNQISHIYTSDTLIQPSYALSPPISFNNPGGNPSKGLLYAASPLIAVGTPATRLTAASNALCKLNIDDSGQANGWAVTISDPQSLYNASASQNLYKYNGVAGSTLHDEIQMPNGPVLITTANTGASGNINPTVTLITLDS